MIPEIKNMIAAIEGIESSFDAIVLDAVKEKESDVLKMNKQQLFNGIDANENGIRPLYSPVTIERKKRKNDPYNRVTLKDEGDFYKSFFVVYQNDKFEIAAKDFKTNFLQKRYGKDVLGLTEKGIDRLSAMIKESIQMEVKKRILQ